MNPAPVITIDGPSGVGKGTLCRFLARQLGWHRLDSGVLYRLTALAALQTGVLLDDEQALSELARGLDAHFHQDRVYLQNQDVSLTILSERCGNAASKIAVLPAVRAALLQRQRDFRRPPGLITDGRDMGTVVFPDAILKLYLSASPQERAQRRYKQLKMQGISASLAALTQEIAERDARDAARRIAPLKPAEDAIMLDTSSIGIDEVKQHALAITRERLPEASMDLTGDSAVPDRDD